MDAAKPSLVMPELSGPFPFAVHAHADDIEERSIAWALRHRLIASDLVEEQVRRSRFGWLTAALYPDGITERVDLVSDFMLWLFAFDDHYIDEPTEPSPVAAAARQVIRCQRIMDEPDRQLDAPDSYTVSFREICIRLREATSWQQFWRFGLAMGDYFRAVTCQVAFRADSYWPIVDEYVALRRHAVGVYPCFALIDFVIGFELPNAIWSRPDVLALNREIIETIAWNNDVLSCPKELNEPWALNLPLLLVRHCGYSLQDAVDDTARRHNDGVAAYLDSARRLRAGDDDHALVSYLDGLEAWLAGNREWHLTSPRYRFDAAVVRWADRR